MNLSKKPKTFNRFFLLEEFKLAPLETLFCQATVAAVRKCSISTIERDRVAGTGVPFVKLGKSVRYSKQSILHWLEKQKPLQSTAQHEYVRGI